jgi:hypothetical protein
MLIASIPRSASREGGVNSTPGSAVELAVGVIVAVGESVGVVFAAQAQSPDVGLGVGHLPPVQATRGAWLGARVAVDWEVVAQAAAAKQTAKAVIIRGNGREKNGMARL